MDLPSQSFYFGLVFCLFPCSDSYASKLVLNEPFCAGINVPLLRDKERWSLQFNYENCQAHWGFIK